MQDIFWNLMEEDGKALGAYLRRHDEMRKLLFVKMAEER